MSKINYAIIAVSVLLILCVGAIFVLHTVNASALPKRVFDVSAKAEKLGSPVSSTVSLAVEGTAQLYESEREARKAEEEAMRGAFIAENSIARDEIKIGQKFGVVTVDNTTINCGLYWGDDSSQLELGAAVHSNDGTQLPGGGRTVLIGGHTGTYFSSLGNAQIGDIIHLSTGYGEFDYEIYDTKVIEEHNLAACMFDATNETCILYTCYPFGILEHTPYRWFVYAKPIKVDKASDDTVNEDKSNT